MNEKEDKDICYRCGCDVDRENGIYFIGIPLGTFRKEMKQLKKGIAKMSDKSVEGDNTWAKINNKVKNTFSNTRLKLKMAKLMQSGGVTILGNLKYEMSICQNCFENEMKIAESNDDLEIVK